MKLKTLLKVLDEVAPLEMAAEWDRVGLQVAPRKNPEVQHLLLTIDMSAAVIQEAVKKKADFIIAYHPLLFSPLHALTPDQRIPEMCMELIQRKITVYSPHTALDAVPGGVNDWLVSGCPEGDIQPLQPLAEDSTAGYGRLLTLQKPAPLSQIVKGMSRHLKVKHARLARAPGQTAGTRMRRIALCPGSGSDVVAGSGADLCITGEMKHHDILDLTQNGSSVLLYEHTVTERGYLPLYARSIRKTVEREVKVSIAGTDRNPVEIRNS